MKKRIAILLSVLCMLFCLAGCGGNTVTDIVDNVLDFNDEEEVGGDWHVWAAYDAGDWTSPDGTEYIYIEYLDDAIRLLSEGDSYNVIADCCAEDGVIHDQPLVCDTWQFTDRNDDGYDDFVFHDMIDDQEMEYVFLYVPGGDTFTFESLTPVGGADTQ